MLGIRHHVLKLRYCARRGVGGGGGNEEETRFCIFHCVWLEVEVKKLEWLSNQSLLPLDPLPVIIPVKKRDLLLPRSYFQQWRDVMALLEATTPPATISPPFPLEIVAQLVTAVSFFTNCRISPCQQRSVSNRFNYSGTQFWSFS